MLYYSHVVYRHYDYGTNKVIPHTVQNSTNATSATSQNPPAGMVSSCHNPQPHKAYSSGNSYL